MLLCLIFFGYAAGILWPKREVRGNNKPYLLSILTHYRPMYGAKVTQQRKQGSTFLSVFFKRFFYVYFQLDNVNAMSATAGWRKKDMIQQSRNKTKATASSDTVNEDLFFMLLVFYARFEGMFH
jgi:hypothetical protein